MVTFIIVLQKRITGRNKLLQTSPPPFFASINNTTKIMFCHQQYCLHSDCFRLHIQYSEILETFYYNLINLISHNNNPH